MFTRILNSPKPENLQRKSDHIPVPASWKLASGLAARPASGVTVYTATPSPLISTTAETCFGNSLDVEAATCLMSNQRFLPVQAEISRFSRKFLAYNKTYRGINKEKYTHTHHDWLEAVVFLYSSIIRSRLSHLRDDPT